MFGVVRLPTGPTVNAPYRSATPEGTAAAETPERMQDGYTSGRVRESVCAGMHERICVHV